MTVLRSSASKAIIISHLTLATSVNTVLNIFFLPSDQPSNIKREQWNKSKKKQTQVILFCITKQAHMLRYTSLSSSRYTNLKSEKKSKPSTQEENFWFQIFTELCEMENIIRSEIVLALKKYSEIQKVNVLCVQPLYPRNSTFLKFHEKIAKAYI